MNRLIKSAFAVSMMGATLTGCSPHEKAPNANSHLPGQSEPSDPASCKHRQLVSLENAKTAGKKIKAEILEPKLPDAEIVAHLEVEKYHLKKDISIVNPIVIRCSGALIAYTGYNAFNHAEGADYKHMVSIDAQDTDFYVQSDNGNQFPKDGNMSDPSKVGKFSLRVLESSNHVGVNQRDTFMVGSEDVGDAYIGYMCPTPEEYSAHPDFYPELANGGC